MKNISFFILIVCIGSLIGTGLYSCEQATSSKLNEKVANAYGFSNFSKIKSIAFTFNIKKDSFNLSRSWKWFPKSQEVYFKDENDSLHYQRDTITSATMKAIDQKFINDKYWLLFPFQLVWDDGCTMTTQYGQHTPISGDTATRLTVAYSDSVGYTPHDSYDLFLDSLHQIKEWNYRHNSVDTPTMSTTWGDVKDFKGIKIATTHYNKDSTFKLWFSGIQVEE